VHDTDLKYELRPTAARSEFLIVARFGVDRPEVM